MTQIFGEPAPNIHFLEALQATLPLDKGIPLEWSDLTPVADSFLANFARSLSTGAIVADVAAWSSIVQFSSSQAHFALGLPHTGELSDADLIRYQDASKRVFDEASERLLAEDESGHAELWGQAKLLFGDYFARLPGLTRSLQVLLDAMLVNAWTAFECAAGDLWTECLNLRANPLALSAINGAKSDGEGQEKKSETLTFIERLIRENEPIRAGSLLRRTSKFSFTGYQGIQTAYVAAFGSDARKLFKTKSFQDLLVLEAIRNVLVHRGGHVDEMFLERGRWSKERFRELDLDRYCLGDRVYVTGVLVKPLIEAVYGATADLFEFVDHWHLKQSLPSTIG